MGTLQSFTPLPQYSFKLLLFNPSKQLISTIQSPDLRRQYKFETKNITEFPLDQLLQKKNEHSNKKIKILIEQRNIIEILHFVSIFHHQILIIRNDDTNYQTENKHMKISTKFQLDLQQSSKIINPFQVQSLQYCMSLTLHELKMFVQTLVVKSTKKQFKKRISQFIWNEKEPQKILIEKRSKATSKLLQENHQNDFRSTEKNMKEQILASHDLKDQQFLSEIVINVPKILFGYHRCPYNPVSMILCHISTKMAKKIMNLLLFYEVDFIRYPSLEIFFASCCNSTFLIGGPGELEEITKQMQMGQYPFQQSVYSDFSIHSQSEIKISNNHDTLSRSSRVIVHKNEIKEIIFYCFCNETFQNYYAKSQQKTIEALKNKFIQLKFFKNLFQLIKELMKDQHKMNTEVLLEKSNTMHRKLKSQRTICDIKQVQSKKNLNETSNVGNLSKTFQDYNQMLPFQRKSSKTDNFHHVPKSLATSRKHISTHSSKHLPPLFNSMKKTFSTLPKNERSQFFNLAIVYFFIHEKQKDRYALQSLSKKIGRQLKHIKIKKILQIEELATKIQHNYVSAIVINDNQKILQQFFEAVDFYSIEDKIAVIKRSQNDTFQTLIKKITEVLDIGLMKPHKFYMYSHIFRKIIVIGSKAYLRHIMTTYPYIRVKIFINADVYQERRRIREIINRKNQLIVCNFPICEVCNDEYKGIVKAKIINYNFHPLKSSSQLTEEIQTCVCATQNVTNAPNSRFSLTQLLEKTPCLSTIYPYENKKVWQSSVFFQKLFSKLKQKKCLFNNFDQFGDQTQILFACADSWIIEQIAMTTLKTFASRYTGIILCPWMKKKVIYQCIKEGRKIIDFNVQSYFSIEKGEIYSKDLTIIEQSKDIFKKLANCLEESQNIFQFSEVMLNLMMENRLFRNSINFAWKSLISLNNHEYPLECCTIFLVLLFGFRRASYLEKKDSISDGTFKSFIFQDREDLDKKNPLLVSIDKVNQSPRQQVQQIPQKVGEPSFSNENKKLTGLFDFPSLQNKNQNKISNQETKNIFPDMKLGKKSSKNDKSQFPKVYLKLCDFQKYQEQGSLRNFFISKNNVYSYIYTTQFLVFQTIDSSQIKRVGSDLVEKLDKKSDAVLLIQRQHKNQQHKSSWKQKDLRLQNRKNQRHIKSRKSSLEQSPLISNLFFFHQNQRKENKIEKQDFILKMKSCRNIEMLPSTDDCILICIQNMELLNYNLFIPFYRNHSNEKGRKKFVLPPFTKLEINANYRMKSSLGPASSLDTHQLKLSPDHQQRFLQKFLQTFLVEQSEYYQDLTHAQKIQLQSAFEPSPSNGKSESQSPDIFALKFKNEQQTMFKTYASRFQKKPDNAIIQTKLIDEKFKLPEADQFFILMNEFKYFSAHHLLISCLPKSNMTNAYHAILLTRKGLYQQALNILHQFNPFRCIIERYINELKMRFNELIEEQREQVLSFRSMADRPKVAKWKLNYEPEKQKFFLKSKTDEDFTFCYNDDSLDVIYKQVLAKIQHDAQTNSNTNNQQFEHNSNSKLISGTILNSKSLRRQKKQLSIALELEEPQQSQQKLVEIKKIESESQGSHCFSDTKRLSVNCFLNQKKQAQQNQVPQDQGNQSPKPIRRREPINSMNKSEFMFRNILNQKNQNQDLLVTFHQNNSKINNQTVQKESISESDSSIKSKSQQSQKFMRDQQRRSVSINVNTRTKSNFFKENEVELKKYTQCNKDWPSNAQKSVIYDEMRKENSLKSPNDQNGLITESEKDKQYQKMPQNEGLHFVQKFIRKDNNLANSRSQIITQSKKLMVLPKHFKTENLVSRNDSVHQINSKQQFTIIQDIMISEQKAREEDKNLIANQQNLRKNQTNQRYEFSPSKDINRNDTSLSSQSQIQELQKEEPIQTIKLNVNSSHNNQEPDQEEIFSESEQIAHENALILNEKKELIISSSDIFGDEEKQAIQFQADNNTNLDFFTDNKMEDKVNQQDNKVSLLRDNKVKSSSIKCKYTLQLSSSDSSSEESATNLDEVEFPVVNAQSKPTGKQLQLSIQQQQQTFQHRSRKPHKLFCQYLKSTSTFLSHNQVQKDPNQLSDQNQSQQEKNSSKDLQKGKSLMIFSFKKKKKSQQNLNNLSNKQTHIIGKIIQVQNNRESSQQKQSEMNSRGTGIFKQEENLSSNAQIQKGQSKANQSQFKIQSQSSFGQLQKKHTAEFTNLHVFLGEEKANQQTPKEKYVIKKRQDKDKYNKNGFTFFVKSKQETQQSISQDQKQSNIELQHQLIEDFHAKLMNNSSMAIKQKANPTFLQSQLNLRRKPSIALGLQNPPILKTQPKLRKKSQKNKSQNQPSVDFKIFPQEMVSRSEIQTETVQNSSFSQGKSLKSLRSKRNVDFDLASLRNLKLNCDVRRKR